MGWLRSIATMDTKAFEAGLDRMDRQVSGFDKRLNRIRGSLATAFAVGGLTSFVRSIAQMGSEISDLSTQTGVGARELQALIGAVEDAGGKQETLLPVLSKLRTGMGRMARGEAAELEKAFAALGISAEALAGLSVDQALELVAQGFVRAGRSASAFSAVTQLLGEDQGPKLIEVLNRLARDGIEPLTQEMERAGRVMGEDVLEDLDKISDGWNRLGKQAKIASVETMSALQDVAQFAASAQPVIGRVLNEILYSAGLDEAIDRIEAAKGAARSLKSEVNQLAEQRRIAKLQEKEAARAAEDMALRESFGRFQKSWNKLLGLDAKGSGFDPYRGVSLANRADELTRVGGVAGVRMDGGQRQLEIQTQVMRNIEANTREQAEQGRGQRTVRIVGE